MPVIASAQTVTPILTSVDDGEPYGGVSIRHPAAAPGVAVPQNAGGACPTGDPCVLTGQYSRYRTSENPYETTLAGFNGTSSFGLTNFYKLPNANTLPKNPNGPPYLFEPVVAQPLYITDMPSAGTNMLLVASLDDMVYGLDADTGDMLWANIDLAGHDCGLGNPPFDNNYNHSPGGTNLVYYGVVATPVIDIYSGTAPTPTAFVVSACVIATQPQNVKWNLDAINLRTGAVIGSTLIQATGFNPSFQVARASLLLTHPTSTTTEVYVSFGTGAGEVVAASPDGCPAGFTSCNYSGWMFLYSVTYNSSSSVTFSQTTTFSTSGPGRPTNVFPPVYAQFDVNGPPCGPSGVGAPSGGGAWDRGDNWAVSQGGIWMSSGGPSSGASDAANVYAASGNGPFGCTGSGSELTCPVSSQPPSYSCSSATNVEYWGESLMRFPSGTSAQPLTPNDFYAPYVQRYTTNSGDDPDPSYYQTGELSRLDLDFGSTPPVIVPFASGTQPMYAILADKSGYMYVVPAEPNDTGATVKLGEFQPGDEGLTNGTVYTQLPFQASNLPELPNNSPGICPDASDGSPWTNNNGTCDEIHEIALVAIADFPNLAIIWPVNESVKIYKGQGGTTGSGYQYRFGTGPSFNPCPPPFSDLPASCTGADPLYPGAGGGLQGAAMAIASGSGDDATLWAITPDPNVGGTWGWLYAYTINVEFGDLFHLWDSGTGIANCGNTSAAGWLATSFTEPTLANGSVYVPSECAVAGTTQPYQNCGQVPSANIQSGILVFSACQ